MSTTTTDPVADEVDRLEQAVDEAREERAELGRKARDFGDGLANLEAELRQLARDDAGMFDDAGHPKPKSRAAELRVQIERGAEGHHWPDLIAGADARITEAEKVLRQHRADHAHELAEAITTRAESRVEAVRSAADALVEAVAGLRTDAAELTAVTSSVWPQGGVGVRDVVFDDGRLAALSEAVGLALEIEPPRSRSLQPREGETPPWIPRVGGGWVPQEDAEEADWDAFMEAQADA